MKDWNNKFDLNRVVNGKTITIGEQDFTNDTVMVKEEDGNIISCTMMSDKDGNLYFTYNNMGVYLSEYMGNFPLDCDYPVDEEAISYNERMRNDSDKVGEFLEMKAMYEDGLLEG